jgi:hypothetical protein
MGHVKPRKVLKYKCFMYHKSVVLNLGYVRSSQGVPQIFKITQNKFILVKFLILWVREGGTIFIWGYAEG